MSIKQVELLITLQKRKYPAEMVSLVYSIEYPKKKS